MASETPASPKITAPCAAGPVFFYDAVNGIVIATPRAVSWLFEHGSAPSSPGQWPHIKRFRIELVEGQEATDEQKQRQAQREVSGGGGSGS